MHYSLCFLVGKKKIAHLYKKRNELGVYLFRIFGIKFVWLDCLIRKFTIASHIEIYDVENNIVKIDRSYMFFYSSLHSHYQNCSISS